MKIKVTQKVCSNLDDIITQVAQEMNINKSDLVEMALRKLPEYDLADKKTCNYSLDDKLVDPIKARTGKNFSTALTTAIINLLVSMKKL